jgi:hypothetical protein
MKEPKFANVGGVYQLIWEEEGVSITLDRLREERLDLMGMISIRSLGPVNPGHLHEAKFNLSSTPARATLAKALDVRLSSVPWAEIIEQASVLVLRSYRTGEPFIDLSKVIPPEASRFRLEPLLLDGRPNLLFGEGGAGKSLIAGYTGVLVQTAVRDAGFDPEPGNVGYLDYESDHWDLAERIRLISSGLFLGETAKVMYRYCHQAIADDIQEIQRYVSEHSISYLIVDSAAPACGGEPENADATIRLFSALRSLKITVLIIAHKTKNGTGHSPFGSVYWTNLPRSVWELQAIQTADQNKMEWGLFHRKNNAGKLHRPIGLRGTFTSDPEHIQPDTLTIERIQVMDVPDLAQHLPVKDRILAALRGGALDLRTITEALDGNEETIRKTLARNPSDFVKVLAGDGNHKWGLAQGGPIAPGR